MADKIKHNRIGARPPRNCNHSGRRLHTSWRMLRKGGDDQVIGLNVGPAVFIARCPRCKIPLQRLTNEIINNEQVKMSALTAECSRCLQRWLPSKVSVSNRPTTMSSQKRKKLEEASKKWQREAWAQVAASKPLREHLLCKRFSFGDMWSAMKRYKAFIHYFGVGETGDVDFAAYIRLLDTVKTSGINMHTQHAKELLPDHLHRAFHLFERSLRTLLP